MTEEKIAEMIKTWLDADFKFQGYDTGYAKNINELARQIYNLVLDTLAGGEMGEKELIGIIKPFCQNPPKIFTDIWVLELAKAVAHAQAIRIRAQCEKEIGERYKAELADANRYIKEREEDGREMFRQIKDLESDLRDAQNR